MMELNLGDWRDQRTDDEQREYECIQALLKVWKAGLEQEALLLAWEAGCLKQFQKEIEDATHK